jgi:molybdenum cofactor guanylyltransferase
MRVGGIVLCGGRSSRMGRAKAWLPFGDELMLPRVVRILAANVKPIIVVAAPGQDVPPLPKDIEIARDPEEGRGPLQGLVAGLQAIGNRADSIYLSSCDVPFLQPGFVQRMIELLGSYSICVPKIGEFHHPLAAVYRIGVLDTALQLLAQNRPRPVYLFELLPTRVVGAADLADVDPTFQSLRNLNSPADYEAALRDLNATK